MDVDQDVDAVRSCTALAPSLVPIPSQPQVASGTAPLSYSAAYYIQSTSISTFRVLKIHRALHWLKSGCSTHPCLQYFLSSHLVKYLVLKSTCKRSICDQSQASSYPLSWNALDFRPYHDMSTCNWQCTTAPRGKLPCFHCTARDIINDG